jgi:hypothetical protein
MHPPELLRLIFPFRLNLATASRLERVLHDALKTVCIGSLESAQGFDICTYMCISAVHPQGSAFARGLPMALDMIEKLAAR